MRARVVVVGAGVGGTIVANRIARSGVGARVTVVNSFGDHLNQPAFLYLALGNRVRTAVPARSMLAPGVALRLEKACAVDRAQHALVLDSGERISYDYLVLATGSRLAAWQVPGLKEGSHNFHCRYAADLLSRALVRFRGGRVVIGASRLPYKCPPSIHEFALMFDHQLRRRRLRDRTQITFVYPAPRIFTLEPLADFLSPVFAGRGIDIVTDFATVSVDPGRKSLVAADGRSLEYDLLVMVPPHTGAAFLKDSGLANSGGWIPVDAATLRAGDRIYALGDAADIAVPKSGAAAHYQADVVAANLLSEIRGFEPAVRYDGRVT